MGAVLERLSLATDSVTELELVKQHLRVTHTAEDAFISVLLESAKQAADDYLCNPFQTVTLDYYGYPIGLPVNKPVPAVVKLWALEVISRAYEQRFNGLQSESESGVGSRNWMSGLDYSLIAAHRLNPGL